MKNLVLVIALFTSIPAFAINDNGGVGAPEVRYFSWCARNTVMEEDAKGNAVVKMDCTQWGQECAQEERIMGAGRIVHAFCRPNR